MPLTIAQKHGQSAVRRDDYLERAALIRLRELPRPSLPEVIAALVARGDWCAAHALATPLQRLTVAIDLMLAKGHVDRWPKLFALAIAGTGFPRREYARLRAILRILHGRGLRVFDSAESEAAWSALPATVHVYRGTTMAEFQSRAFGICWTLDRAVAERFATRAEVARMLVDASGAPEVGTALVPDGFDAESVVLSATVERSAVAGMLGLLDERELIVRPDSLRNVLPLAPVDMETFTHD